MAPWLIPAAMTVMSASKNDQAEEDARKSARAKLRARYLSKLGYPSDQLDAVEADKQIDNQYGSQNWLGPAALQMLQRFGQK